MEPNLKVITEKVDQLAERFGKMEDAMVEVVKIQVELTQVMQANDKRDNVIEKLQDRVNDVEKVTNVNSLTLAKSERLGWILITVAAAAIGKLII